MNLCAKTSTEVDLYDIFCQMDKDQDEDGSTAFLRSRKKKECDLEPDNCTVCLNKVVNDGIVTPCGHSFHRPCLEQAYLAIGHCPNCRQHLPMRWLHTNRIGIQRTAAEYWDYITETCLPPPPEIGPLLPSHQRQYDYDMNELSPPPPMWSRLWISDRLVELRIRFNIPSDYDLTVADLQVCEANGIRGITPEWTFPSWVDSISDSD